MKQHAKIATLAVALFTGISGTALGNGTEMPPPPAAPAPAPPQASERYIQPPMHVAKPQSNAGWYISGAAAVAIPGSVDVNTGYEVNGAVGYDFDPGRLEFAIGYQQHDLKNFSTDLSYWTFLANGYYDFDAGLGGGIKPYLMGGLGVATEQDAPHSENSTIFAWQLGTGLGFKIDNNTTLELGYRFFKPEGGAQNLSSHNILAGIRYKF